ncbi:MAG: sel1 repeat family protein, partial [Bradyrhizobium sp.]
SRAVRSGADTGQSQSFSKTVLTNLTQIPPTEAQLQTADQPSTPASTTASTTALGAFAALLTNDAAPPQLPAATSPSAQPGPVVPRPAALPDPPASPILSREKTAAMLQRGRDLIAAGDIASARLILQHLAEAGSAEASLTLAGTFDPVALSKLGAIGVPPDPAKARAWYAKAAEQGSPEARRLAR